MDRTSRVLQCSLALTNALKHAYMPDVSTAEEQLEQLKLIQLRDWVSSDTLEEKQRRDGTFVAQRLHLLYYAAKPSSDYHGHFSTNPNQQVLLCRRIQPNKSGVTRQRHRIPSVARNALPPNVLRYEAAEAVGHRHVRRLFEPDSFRGITSVTDTLDVVVHYEEAPTDISNGADIPVKRLEVYVVVKFSKAPTIRPEFTRTFGKRQFGFGWHDVAKVVKGETRLGKREKAVVVGLSDSAVVLQVGRAYAAAFTEAKAEKALAEKVREDSEKGRKGSEGSKEDSGVTESSGGSGPEG